MSIEPYQRLESFKLWAKIDPNRADCYISSNQEQVVKVWRFTDAPTEYQRLAWNGGNGDWIALVPVEYGSIPFFIEQMSSGLFWVGVYAVDEGLLYIGANS